MTVSIAIYLVLVLFLLLAGHMSWKYRCDRPQSFFFFSYLVSSNEMQLYEVATN